MAFERELETALGLATLAGVLIKKYYDDGIGHDMKANQTPVTRADIESNELIMKGLRASFPDDGIISEELPAVNASHDRIWHIDPLDGTRSFVERAGTFAVHIGLSVAGKPVLGVVHQPLTQATYSGIVGQGAYLSMPGNPKQEMAPKHLDGLVASIDRRKDHEKYIGLFKRIGVTGTAPTGSEGLRIMKVAEGLAHFRIGDRPTNSWDLCAPHAIHLAAGGACCYVENDEPIVYSSDSKMKGTHLLAISREVLQLVRKGYKEEGL